MSTTRMLTTEEFDYMKNYQSFIENRSQHQSMKRKLLKEIIKLYGEKFYRLHEGTRKALDRLCWFAAEKGFCFLVVHIWVRHMKSQKEQSIVI